MAGYGNPEPVLRYYEEVRVRRNFVQEPDVIIYYINSGQGRGGEYNLFYTIWSISGIV